LIKLQLDNQKLLENFHANEKSYEEKMNNMLAENEKRMALINKKNKDKFQECKLNFTEQKASLLAKHQKEMEELRKEANKQLNDAKCTIDKKKLLDIENIKEITEKSRAREIKKLQQQHNEMIEKLQLKHQTNLEDKVKELNSIRILREERIKSELNVEFDAKLESQLVLLRHKLMKESDIYQLDLESKHNEQMYKKTNEHKNEVEQIIKNHQDLLNDKVKVQQNEIENLKAKK